MALAGYARSAPACPTNATTPQKLIKPRDKENSSKQTTFTYSQLFGLWERGILNGDVFLKHRWPLLERGCWIFGTSGLIQCYRYFASEGSSLCRWKVLHSQMAPGAGAPGLRSMLLAEPCQPLLSWVKPDQFYCQIHPGDIPN